MHSFGRLHLDLGTHEGRKIAGLVCAAGVEDCTLNGEALELDECGLPEAGTLSLYGNDLSAEVGESVLGWSPCPGERLQAVILARSRVASATKKGTGAQTSMAPAFFCDFVYSNS